MMSESQPSVDMPAEDIWQYVVDFSNIGDSSKSQFSKVNSSKVELQGKIDELKESLIPVRNMVITNYHKMGGLSILLENGLNDGLSAWLDEIDDIVSPYLVMPDEIPLANQHRVRAIINSESARVKSYFHYLRTKMDMVSEDVNSRDK